MLYLCEELIGCKVKLFKVDKEGVKTPDGEGIIIGYEGEEKTYVVLMEIDTNAIFLISMGYNTEEIHISQEDVFVLKNNLRKRFMNGYKKRTKETNKFEMLDI